MSIERIIRQILSRLPNVSKEEILERFETEKKKTGGLISDETLMRMIAAEFDVDIVHDRGSVPTFSSEHLIPGLNNVALAGRVVAVFPPRAFKGNKSGRIASLLIVDQSGIIRVVLWDDKTSLVESAKISTGQIVRVSHAYTREDRKGKVELHVGEKGEIEISPRDVNAKDYPTIGKFTTKTGELVHAHRNKRVNVEGTVTELFPASDFSRKDGSSGRVMRFRLADETGEVSVVVWNENVDELEKILCKSARLQIVNASVRRTLGSGLEVHVDAETHVEAARREEELMRIADLREGQDHVNVEGEVASKPIVRNVKTSKGELVCLAVFELKDETGRMWVSAWRRHAERAMDLGSGDEIVMKNAYVRKGFADQLELSTKNATTITRRETNQQDCES